MAIPQVRVQFNGQWYALTYNSETKQYKGQIAPPTSSHSQSGGYYGLTVEASNDSGGVSMLDAANFPALRLVVRETTEPTLELVSPGEGYLTTNSPTLVFTASDKEDGSGVALGTLSILLDGMEAVPHSTSAISGEYRITCALSGLSDGAHTVSAAVSDYDGNRTDLSVSYVVDTAPPELSVRLSNAHRVVDGETAVVAGDTLDVTAPPVTAKITCGGVDQGAVTLGGRGRAGIHRDGPDVPHGHGPDAGCRGQAG